MEGIKKSRRNRQAAIVLNKVEYDSDGNPVYMVEGQDDSSSANFGTLREPRRGGCYKGDGVGRAYQLGNRALNNPNTTFFIAFIVDSYPESAYDSIFGTSPSGGYSYLHRLYYTANKFYTYWCPEDYLAVSDIINVEIPITLGEYYLLHFTIDSVNRCRIIKNGVELYNQVYTPRPITNKLKNYYAVLGSQVAGLEYRGVRVFGTGILSGVVTTKEALQHYQDLSKLPNLPVLSHYKCDENSGSICYDSSGNGNHGTLINAITVNPETNPNSIHQYQDIYSWHNEVGYNKVGDVFIPRNESIKTVPWKDILGNDLQVVGKVPGRMKFVDSNCFQGNGVAYLSLPTIFPVKQNFSFSFDLEVPETIPSSGVFLKAILSLGSFTLATLDSVGFWCSYLDGSGISTGQLNGSTAWNWNNLKGKILRVRLKRYFNVVEIHVIVLKGAVVENPVTIFTVANPGVSYGNTTFKLNLSLANQKFFNVKYEELDEQGSSVSVVGYWPLCEDIYAQRVHKYLDISGNSHHATLVNGVTSNNGKQSNYHILQKGFTSVGVVYDITSIQEALISGLLSIVQNGCTYQFDSEGNLEFTYVPTGNVMVRLVVNSALLDISLPNKDLSIVWKGSLETSDSSWNYLRWLGFQKSSGSSITIVDTSNLNYYYGDGDWNTINIWPKPGANLGYKIKGLKLEMVSKISKHLTNDTDCLGNPLTHTQDGKSFLPSGCKLLPPRQPSLVQADKITKFWFDSNNEPYKIGFDTLLLKDPIAERIFIGNQDITRIKPIAHYYNPLTGRQKLIERIVRNVVDTVDDNSLSFDVKVTSDSLGFSLYNAAGNTFAAVIDWGDGTTQSVNTTATQTITKNYTAAGTYTVKVTGTMHIFGPSYYNGGPNGLKVTKINNWGSVNLRVLNIGTTSVVSIPNGPITGIDQSVVINFGSGFAWNATNLTNLPEDLFKYCTKATSFGTQGAFNGCVSLAIPIPEQIFRYCVNLTSLVGAFTGCTGLVGQIPEDLLRYNTKLTNVSGLVASCTGLTGSIPERLLSSLPLLTDARNLLYNCTNISGSIPELLFASNPNLEYVAWGNFYYAAFAGCVKLTGSIPENLFKFNPKLKSFSGIFWGCVGLTGAIPEKLFWYSPLATEFAACFSGCTGLTGSIPEKLFWYSVNAINFGYLADVHTYYGCFSGCTGLTGSLPAYLLLYNTKATVLSSMFYNCTGLTGGIPAGLLDSLTLLQYGNQIFAGCIGLTSIPDNLLQFNTELTTVSGLFSNTSVSSIPAGLFDYCLKLVSFQSTFRSTKITTVLENTFVNNTLAQTFSACFYDCRLLSSIPDGMLSTNINVTDLSSLLAYCTSMRSLPANLLSSLTKLTNVENAFAAWGPASLVVSPDMFQFNTELTNIRSVFSSTTLASIPAGLLRNNSKITQLYRAFAGVSPYGVRLTVDPDIFRYLVAAVSMDSVFRGTALENIPATLFYYNILVTKFTRALESTITVPQACPTNLFINNVNAVDFTYALAGNAFISLPNDLFRYCIKATTFFGVVYNCPQLTALPEDLFYYNSLVTNYRSALEGCRNLALPSRLFNTANLGKVTDWSSFAKVTAPAYSPTGTIQKIWGTTETPAGDVVYATLPTRTDALDYCTGLSNYSQAPVAWT